MRNILFTILILYTVTSYADEKKAIKHLEKREYDKVMETLEKEISKDSLNPGPYFVYSLLYNDNSYSEKNIDTAYYFILKSLDLFPPGDEKELERLDKIYINDSTLTLQKEKLDLEAYERAKTIHTLEAYNFYIHNFEVSIYLADAIRDRNALAFEFVKERNTYHAYYEFMQTYPEADEYQEAQEQYQTLLFKSQTSDGNLMSYTSFLAEHPNSPYRNEAIKAIYRISTCSNSEESLLQFIKDFPESVQTKKAIDRLYHNYREAGGKEFSYDYNFLDLSDSIINIDQYDDQFVIPVFENDKYGFITGAGEMIIPYTYEDIDETYLCGNIKEDFFRVRKNGKQLIITKDETTIYQNPYNDVQELVSGLIKILNKGKYGAIFKTGEAVLPITFDEIEKLDGQLIKARLNDLWYLYSVNGIQLLQFGCKEIYTEGTFLLIRKDDAWAITNQDYLFNAYVEENIILDFKYDDYALIEPTQILCILGDKEGILNNKLEYELPLERQRINTLPEGWLIQKDSTYHLYDDAFVKISGTHGLSSIVHKGRWLTGKSASQWILYFNFAPFPDVFAYDSVNILSENYVFAIEEGDPVLIFSNYKKVKIGNYQRLRILHNPAVKQQSGSIIDFISVDFDRDRSEIYASQGDLILKGSNLDIQLLGEEYLKKTYRGKFGLSDTSGQELLKPQFQGIANYENGYVSLLNNKKFGIYNKNLGIYIRPGYDRLIKPYNNQYLIAYKSGGYGLIDKQGGPVTDFTFDEIRYWNDTSLLGMTGASWTILDFKNKEILEEEIKDFDFLVDDVEKVMIFRKEEQFGIISNFTGVIIKPTFNDILNIGSNNKPVYFAEKYIPEAAFYIIIYYNAEGEILRKQVFNDQEYDKIYCN